MSNKNDKEKRPSTWKVWVLASRPHTLTAALAPVIVGYNLTLAYYKDVLSNFDSTDGNNHPLTRLTIHWVLFCILIQLGTNLHNDYADFVKGADDDKRVGQARATQKGWLTPEQTCRGCDTCLCVALGLGLHLAKQVASSDGFYDWFMVGIVLTSVFNAVAYTGGPYPLGYIGLENVSIAYSGLGDLFVFLYFGLVATMTVPYLILRHSSAYCDASLVEVMSKLQPAFLCALPVGWLATGIIVVNNLRDRETDVGAGKRTLAVRLGGTFCRVEYALLIIGSFVSVPFLFSASMGWIRFLSLFAILLAIPQLRAVSLGEKDFGGLNPYVGGTARLQLAFCILFSVSLRWIP